MNDNLISFPGRCCYLLSTQYLQLAYAGNGHIPPRDFDMDKSPRLQKKLVDYSPDHLDLTTTGSRRGTASFESLMGEETQVGSAVVKDY